MFYVYMLASGKHGTLYLGVTNNLVRRIYEHKEKRLPGFTARYGVDRLVWFESYDDPAKRDESFRAMARLIREQILMPGGAPPKGNIHLHCGGGMHRLPEKRSSNTLRM